jgi:DNA polymerase III subunit epsilon
MNVLFFDTETTGLPNWKEPSSDPNQPHVIDISCELWDADEPMLIERYDAIINIGVPIPPEMTEVHGITDAMAAEGAEPSVVLETFLRLVKRADLLAGHNVSFDIRMMRIMAARVTGEKWEPVQPTFCTMRKSTHLVKAIKPNARFDTDYKWPNLGEAHQHFFGEKHSDAHRAAPDCEAARKIYFEIMKMEKSS